VSTGGCSCSTPLPLDAATAQQTCNSTRYSLRGFLRSSSSGLPIRSELQLADSQPGLLGATAFALVTDRPSVVAL